jgi:hypothetical protein
MAKAPRPYTRLTRATASALSYRSLWLGSDHLLVVQSTGYTEDYRRIQLRDIQGVFVIESERRNGWAVLWICLGMLGAGFFGINFFSTDDLPIKSLVLLAIAVIGGLWNHLLGETCKVYVLTGVQTLELPSLVRRYKVKKVLARLEPLIADAQRTLASPVPVAASVPESPPSL